MNLAGNIVLLPLIGLPGASIASSLSYTVSAIIILYFFTRRTSVPLAEVVVPKREDFRVFASVVSAAIGAVVRKSRG